MSMTLKHTNKFLVSKLCCKFIMTPFMILINFDLFSLFMSNILHSLGFFFSFHLIISFSLDPSNFCSIAFTELGIYISVLKTMSDILGRTLNTLTYILEGVGKTAFPSWIIKHVSLKEHCQCLSTNNWGPWLYKILWKSHLQFQCWMELESRVFNQIFQDSCFIWHCLYHKLKCYTAVCVIYVCILTDLLEY